MSDHRVRSHLTLAGSHTPDIVLWVLIEQCAHETSVFFESSTTLRRAVNQYTCTDMMRMSGRERRFIASFEISARDLEFILHFCSSYLLYSLTFC